MSLGLNILGIPYKGLFYVYNTNGSSCEPTSKFAIARHHCGEREIRIDHAATIHLNQNKATVALTSPLTTVRWLRIDTYYDTVQSA